MSDKNNNLSDIEQKILNKIEKSGESVKYLAKKNALNKLKHEKLNNSNKKDKDSLTRSQRYKLRKHDVKSGFKSHLVAFLAVNITLAVIWYITMGKGGGHPWFLYSLFGWGIGLVSHFFSCKGELKKLDIIYENDIESDGKSINSVNTHSKKVEGSTVETDAEFDDLSEPYFSYVKETKLVRKSLMEQISEADKVDKDLLQRVKDSLNHYTDRIFYLSKRGNFLEKAIDQFDSDTIDESKDSIRELLKDENLDAGVRKEYENNLLMLDRQLESLRKVNNVKSKILANLSTSLVTLNTLKLDFIRLQYITDETAESTIQSLNNKTEEIDDYIDILSDSLEDINNQM